MEAPVLAQQQWEAVHERRARGQNISAISRELELDRKTVRSCLRQASWQPYRRAEAASVLDAHRQWLTERAAQVNHSARILWQELRAQRGFTGSYVIVRRAVAPLRLAASVAALTQARFETGPGEQAQCDWGQITVPLGGVRTEVHIFVTLGYSRRGFALGSLRERMGDLLAAHEAAFAHFGGRCEFLLYDRMRTVVLGTSEGRPRLNPTFAAFASHWGFTPRLCQPYRAQTKGKVESGVKYVKRNFVPGRVFRDLEDFNEQLAAWQVEIADLREHGTTHQRPIDRFAEESRALAPSAGHASFLQAMVRERVVAEDWLVSIDGNRYSVPFMLIGKAVQVVRQGGAWVIRHRGAVVAEHAVLAGRAIERAPRARSRSGGAQRATALLGASPIGSDGSVARRRGTRLRRLRAAVRRLTAGGHGMSKSTSKAASAATAAATMTTPAQLERLGEHLRKLRLLKSGERLEALLQHAAVHELPYAEFLEQVLGEEVAAKMSKNIAMRTAMARFPFGKPLETFEFDCQPSIDRKQVQQLASCHFIEHGDNVIVLGPPGVGKTHLAVSLGLKAIEAGYRVLFTTAANLIEKLTKAHAEGRPEEKLKLYTAPRLLIIDEIGYLPIDRVGANLFFQLISRRYERGPMVLTSNQSFGAWGEVFGDRVIATAILNRLLHHAVTMNIRGNSYRLKDRLKAGLVRSHEDNASQQGGEI
jgi:DNA replication protein DnaC/transposase